MVKVKRVSPSAKSNKYDSLSVDQFFEKDFEEAFENSDEDESSSDSENAAPEADAPGSKSEEEDDEDHIFSNGADKNESEDGSESEKDGDDDHILSNEADENESGDEVESHKQALSKLKDTDPEFYKFLQDNDKKLLQFDVSDAEDDEASEGDGEGEAASDESDFEADDKPKDHGVITLKVLKTWQNSVQTDKTNKTIVALTQAFHAALLRVLPEEEQDPCPYKVEGSSVFNAVVQICVIHLGPALRRFLGLKEGSKQPPHKCKKFTKIKGVLKGYFMDLLKLLSGVTSANIQTVLLKHLHYMSPFIASYPNITKSILKRLIVIWGSTQEGVRVLAFFCILRITNGQRAKFLDTVLKSMYMTYVKNSKFVSVSSLASLNFMRRSLVEMFALDISMSYQHVFLYIRQLAIHLRNAITVNKKENVQAVYNWQYVNSLKLWGNLLATTCNKPQLQQLIYPLVQVCLGTIKLLPTTQYFPLRFHVVQILMDLSRDTGVFVPVLPFLLEVLTSYDFNKKHLKVSMKPLHFTCLLRVSKSQMSENGFKDSLIETIYGQMLEYLAAQSHSIAFPGLSLICNIQIKQFLKKCANANYNRKIKQILEKIEQNSQFIEKERKKLSLNMNDFKKIGGWESQIKNRGTPLTEFYESWSKLHTIKKDKQLANSKEQSKKSSKRKRNKKNDDSDDDGDSDGGESVQEEEKRKRGKRGGKKMKKKLTDESGPVEDSGEADIVEEFKMSDW